MYMHKTVAVVGGGPSGLASAKAMLDQGLKVTLFERNDGIGGVWHERDGNAWPSMNSNLSKYSMSFSDFHWDRSVPLFPTTLRVNEYLVNYAERFGVKQTICFNSNVTSITQLVDKRWLVKWNDDQEKAFDSVVFAVGIFSNPHIPKYEQLDVYKGLILHSKDYGKFKRENELTDKRVLVVGHSHSAAEICSDLVNHGCQSVLNVFRRPYWMLEKMCNAGATGQLSADLLFYNRKQKDAFKQFDNKSDEYRFRNTLMATMCPKQNNVPELFNDPSSTEPPMVTMSNHYVEKVKSGKIRAKKGEVKSFTSTSVVFSDGTSEEVDVVIFSTGYTAKMDCFEKDFLEKIEYKEDDSYVPFILYKSTFPHNVENIAFVGMLQEPLFPFLELQARWASLVFSGKLQLPTNPATILEGLQAERKLREARPRLQTARRDIFIEYFDSVADEIGAKPDFAKIERLNPELLKCFHEDVLSSSHYRINDDYLNAIEVVKEIKEIKEKCLKNEIDFNIY